MKAEHGHIRDAPHACSLVLSTEGMASVLDNNEAALPRYLEDGGKLCRVTGIIHWKNGSCLWGNSFRKRRGIQIEGIWSDVCKNWGRTLIQDAIAGGGKSQWSGDRFVAGFELGGE